MGSELKGAEIRTLSCQALVARARGAHSGHALQECLPAIKLTTEARIWRNCVHPKITNPGREAQNGPQTLVNCTCGSLYEGFGPISGHFGPKSAQNLRTIEHCSPTTRCYDADVGPTCAQTLRKMSLCSPTTQFVYGVGTLFTRFGANITQDGPKTPELWALCWSVLWKTNTPFLTRGCTEIGCFRRRRNHRLEHEIRRAIL